MPVALTIFDGDQIPEQCDAEYQCSFIGADAAETVLVPSAVTAIVCWLKDDASNTTINSRSAQNVLNANGGTLSAAGVFVLRLGTLDNIIVGAPTTQLQRHRLTLKVSYTRLDSASGTLTHDVRFDVRALTDIT